MSLTYAKGDLLAWEDWNVVAHGVSQRRVLGAGLAKQIADLYPEAAEAYFDSFERVSEALYRGPELGDLIVAPVDEGKHRIVHCFTQADIGTHKRQLSYDALVAAMESLRELLEGAAKEGRVWTLGLPMWIGGGLAGGDPQTIQAILESVWARSPVRCVIVEWDKHS